MYLTFFLKKKKKKTGSNRRIKPTKLRTSHLEDHTCCGQNLIVSTQNTKNLTLFNPKNSKENLFLEFSTFKGARAKKR
jgi:hypothetical protein